MRERPGERERVKGKKDSAYLLPAKEMKSEMAADELKVCFVTGDHCGTDAAGREGDQDVERQCPDLIGFNVLTLPYDTQDLSCLYPMRFRWRQDSTPIQEMSHELSLESWSSPAQKLMQHHRRAANHVGSLEQTKGESTSSEVLDIDRGVQDGELSWS
jgi:hypothetical protein